MLVELSAVCMHYVEHGHFVPLVSTTTGGMGKSDSQVYKRLTS